MMVLAASVMLTLKYCKKKMYNFFIINRGGLPMKKHIGTIIKAEREILSRLILRRKQ